MTDQWKVGIQPGPECLTVEQLSRPELSGEQRSHLDSCPHCQTELAMLREFETGVPTAEEAPAVQWISRRLEERKAEITGARPEPSPGKGWWAWIRTTQGISISALSMVTVLLIAGIAIQQRAGQGPGLNTNAGRDVVLRSVSLDLIAPIGDISQLPPSLRWQSVAGATHFHVRVTEVDGTVVWETDTASTSVDLPSAVRERAVPAKTLVWEVTARDSAGHMIGVSPLGSFRIKP